MHRPPVWAREPRIKPNYSMRKYKSFPHNQANSVKQVLLYTNVTESNMLNSKTSYINRQKSNCKKVNELHHQAFIVRQIMQEMQLEAMGINFHLLPKEIVERNRHLAMFHNMFYTGGKDLPMHQRLDRFFLKSLQNAKDKQDVLKLAKHRYTSSSTFPVLGESPVTTSTSSKTGGSHSMTSSSPRLPTRLPRSITHINPMTAPGDAAKRPTAVSFDASDLVRSKTLPEITTKISTSLDEFDALPQNPEPELKLPTFEAGNDNVMFVKRRPGTKSRKAKNAADDPRFSELETLLHTSKSWNKPQCLANFTEPHEMNEEDKSTIRYKYMCHNKTDDDKLFPTVKKLARTQQRGSARETSQLSTETIYE